MDPPSVAALRRRALVAASPMDGLRRYLGDPIASWRTGSSQSQAMTLAALLCGVALCAVVSVVEYALMPLTAYFVWLLLGMLLLRFRPLVVLTAVTVCVQVLAVLLDPPMTLARSTARSTSLSSPTDIFSVQSDTTQTTFFPCS